MGGAPDPLVGRRRIGETATTTRGEVDGRDRETEASRHVGLVGGGGVCLNEGGGGRPRWNGVTKAGGEDAGRAVFPFRTAQEGALAGGGGRGGAQG